MSSKYGANKEYQYPFQDPELRKRAGAKGGLVKKQQAEAKRAEREQIVTLNKLLSAISSGKEVSDTDLARLSLAGLANIAHNSDAKDSDRMKAHELILRYTKTEPAKQVQSQNDHRVLFVPPEWWRDVDANALPGT